MPKFTKMEEAILKILSDGNRHPKYQLIEVLREDNLDPATALRMHISRIRKKLNPIGQDLICELSGRIIYYRHVRLISYD